MNSQKSQGIPDAPIHPLGALATIILDWLWAGIELPVTMSIAFLPTLLPLSIALGLLCFSAVVLTQRFVSKDEWGASVAKGLVMGIAAGVPYPVIGTMIGTPLILWSGIHNAQKLLSSSQS